MRTRRLLVQIIGDSRSLVRAIDNLTGSTRKMDAWAKASKLAFQGVVAGTAAVGLGLGYAVQQFASFEDQLNQAWSIMGDVSDDVKRRMSDTAREVALQTRFSAQEVAAGYYALASAGMDAEQQIAALPMVAQFAQAGMVDLDTATQALVQAQFGLGLASDDAGENLENLTRIADVLTETNNIAVGSLQDFADALANKAAGALAVFNKDIEEGAAVLAAFAKRGFTGEMAGEKLAIFLRDTSRAAARNTEEFKKFGIEIFDAEGNMKNLADVVAEFEDALGPMSDAEKAAALESMGMTRAVGDIIRVLMGSSEEIRGYEEQLREAGGTTKDVAERQMSSFAAQLDLLKNHFNDIALEIGERLVPKLLELVIWLREHLPGAVAIMKRVWEEILKPVLMAFWEIAEKYVIPAIKEIGKWLLEHEGVAKAVAFAIIGFLLGLAVGYVILQIAAVISVAVQMVQMALLAAKWVWLRRKAVADLVRIAVFYGILALQALWSIAVQIAQMVLLGAKWAWLGAVAMANGIKMGLSWLIAMGPIALIIAAVVLLAFIIIWKFDEIKAVVTAAWDWIWGRGKAVFEWFQRNWPTLLGILTGPFGWAVLVISRNWDTIVRWAAWAWNNIARGAGWIRDRIVGAFDWVRDRVVGAWDWIAQRVNSVISFISARIRDLKVVTTGISVGAKNSPIGGLFGLFGGTGGIVPSYFATGGMFKRRGTDTIPAMLSPGEMVLTPYHQMNLWKLAQMGIDAAGRGNRGDTYYITNVDVHGSIISERDLIQLINREQSKGVTLAARRR